MPGREGRMPSEPLRSSESLAAPRPGRTLRELFGIERRSLACFRIGLGLLLLWDLWGRAKTLREHYTGEGVFPRELAQGMRPDSVLFRVFLWSDRLEVQAALFGLFALIALLFVVGWHTRIVSVLAFVMLASLVRRNPYVCHTGDVLLKALAFWAMFLPLGAHLSLDRLRGSARPPDGARVLTLATVGVLLQIAVFYFMAGILKARYEIWRSGQAVWTFTHVIEYTRPFGAWLGQFPAACRFLTYATLVVESLSPFVLFIPFGTARIRSVLFFVLAAFHLTLQATIHIGIFQILCIVMVTLFLPGEFWDWLARRLPEALRARWRGLRETAERFRVRPRPSPVPAPLGRVLSRASTAFVVLALAVVVISNANSAIKDPYDRNDEGWLALPQVIDDYGRQMSLVQSWNMFTDIDRLFFGWFLVLGQQVDGQAVDVLEEKPFRRLQLPEDYASLFPNHDSRRYWRELTLTDDGKPREALQKATCDYLAREWQRAGHPALTHLAIFHVGRVPSEARKRDQVKLVCRWEAPHEVLKDAPAEEQQRWAAWRESWKTFLENLPETAPAMNRE
jgi:hypothetical protein